MNDYKIKQLYEKMEMEIISSMKGIIKDILTKKLRQVLNILNGKLKN